jgi:hypothetical protein
MVQQEEVKSWILDVMGQAMAQLAEHGDDVGRGVHVDVYDDQVTNSPGRVCSFQLDAKGKLEWFSWRTEDAVARADWPLKLLLQFGEGVHFTVWVHERRWNFDKSDTRHRVVRR